MVPLAAATAPGADCFSAADNARLRFEAFQQAPPPRDGARYPHYPLSAAVSGQLGRLASAPKGIQTWYYHWANRAATPLVGAGGRQIVRKLNLEPSWTGNRRHRSAFSSIDRANACTMAQAASLLGQDARARRYARDAGVTLINERALPDAAPPSPAFTLDRSLSLTAPAFASVEEYDEELLLADDENAQPLISPRTVRDTFPLFVASPKCLEESNLCAHIFPLLHSLTPWLSRPSECNGAALAFSSFFYVPCTVPNSQYHIPHSITSHAQLDTWT